MLCVSKGLLFLPRDQVQGQGRWRTTRYCATRILAYPCPSSARNHTLYDAFCRFVSMFVQIVAAWSIVIMRNVEVLSSEEPLQFTRVTM